MRYLSVCSGIEAATVAWHPLGWTPVAFSEIEPFPSAVLAHHYPQVPNLGDMTNHAAWPLQPGDIDLLVGGTPCQSFSVAGLRKGLSDPRGGLMLTYLEIARRLRPRWVVWENVPGVLSSNGGRDFGSFLGALGELGYGWAYRVLDAQWVRTQRHPRAVPQRRRRVFVVGCLGNARAPAAVLFERESVQRDSAPRRAKGEGAAADASDGAGSGRITSHDVAPCIETTVHDYSRADGFTMVADIVGAIDCRISAQRAQNAAAEHLIAVPIRAAGGDIGGGSENLAVAVTVSNGEPRVSDCMGTLDSARESRGSNQQRFVMQPVPFRKSKLAQSTTDDESWVEAEQANTLNAFDTGERDTHAVAFKPGQSAAARSMGAQEEVACTLEGGGGGNNRQAVAIGTDMYNHAITGDVAATMGTPGSSVNASGPTVMQAHGFYSTDGSHGVNQQPEVSPAVKVGSGLGIPSPPAVAHALRGEGFDASEDGTGRGTPIIPVAHAIGFIPKAPPNSRSMGEEVENGPTVTTHMMGQGVSLSLPMTVRRLTPRECERLQAFPDDYTLIPWRKKPADQCPDGPRYKALGNSMAVNCMEWIGERIAAYEAKERKQ